MIMLWFVGGLSALCGLSHMKRALNFILFLWTWAKGNTLDRIYGLSHEL